ncbi:hypothetical protein AAW28_09570 [Lacticaseibacillus casei]|nr:hypothetical protein AAW28_09570 [Lacticaseibacillus casei]
MIETSSKKAPIFVIVHQACELFFAKVGTPKENYWWADPIRSALLELFMLGKLMAPHCILNRRFLDVNLLIVSGMFVALQNKLFNINSSEC